MKTIKTIYASSSTKAKVLHKFFLYLTSRTHKKTFVIIFLTKLVHQAQRNLFMLLHTSSYFLFLFLLYLLILYIYYIPLIFPNFKFSFLEKLIKKKKNASKCSAMIVRPQVWLFSFNYYHTTIVAQLYFCVINYVIPS